MTEIVKFSTLLGKTLTSIEKTEDTMTFITRGGGKYELFHERDCCECVRIEDIIGDLNDLLNSPILMAEEIESVTEKDEPGHKYYDNSHTWTFYKLATIKGYVTIRWLGESNGWYSESVSFVEHEKDIDDLRKEQENEI